MQLSGGGWRSLCFNVDAVNIFCGENVQDLEINEQRVTATPLFTHPDVLDIYYNFLGETKQNLWDCKRKAGTGEAPSCNPVV